MTQLEGLFQNQHDMGYWELDCLDLVLLDSERVRKLLEQSGCKSLGEQSSLLQFIMARNCDVSVEFNHGI